jgi:hypothetical protein
MIVRGPVLPSRRLFAWLSGLVLGAITIASSLVALELQVVPPALAVALPIMTSLAAMALMIGTLEVFKRLERAGWNASAPKLRNWALYLGGFGLAGLGIGGLRGMMMLAIEGESASAWLLNAELGLCTYGALLVAVVMDLQTRYERKALIKRTESLVAVHTLFESREAWIHARNRRRDELHRIMTERVEPELAAIHAALSPTGRPDMRDEALGDLCDRLDRLRDAEIRHLSHLTHPSIIDIGLQAALRGLARHYRDRFTVVLEADAALLERVSGTLRLTIYRSAELLLSLGASDAARPVTMRIAPDMGNVVLEVLGSPETFDFRRARRDGQLALLEARVAMLDGTWQLQDGEEGSGFRVFLPEAAGTQSLSQRRK